MPTNPQGYAAIVAEAQRLGWPVDHEYDLYDVDRGSLLEKERPTTQFYWAITEHGTHIWYQGSETHLDYAKACKRDYQSGREPIHYYHFNGEHLLPTTIDQIIQYLQVSLRKKGKK